MTCDMSIYIIYNGHLKTIIDIKRVKLFAIMLRLRQMSSEKQFLQKC
jgi:hypothetical protein